MAFTMRNDAAFPYPSRTPEQIGRHPSGFQAPQPARIGTVTLQVADVERSLAFYQGVIGFRQLAVSTDGAARWVTLGAAGDERPLLVLVEKPGVRPVPQGGRLGLYHHAVLLPSQADLGRLLRHARSLGVHAGASDHLYSEALYLVDPDGLTVEVYRDRPRSEWRVSPAGEILSAIEPLQEPQVLAAAGSEAWAGLPAGTTIGHVHFYVGNLAQAQAFYHAGLGLTQTLWSLPTASFLAAGGYHHHVAVNTWAARSPVATADDAKLLTWEWLLPDEAGLAATIDSVRQAGFRVEYSPDGTALAQDPWGITVRLVAEGA
ncbi:VOC family protein [Hymenobacter weizhouensis]|uniref:VOC family protein n=1 Tax=Hymenobacter sp. YIM 151500-1 TaxID=2987689 RepID=UPI002225C431|nr:VOC family protein [Hymenobacter sp. YIM 151500-1]UYZ64648.1 VOC family protein [Hymenobacter sp. YIM 151500-1]